jgi:hypothetical protein
VTHSPFPCGVPTTSKPPSLVSRLERASALLRTLSSLLYIGLRFCARPMAFSSVFLSASGLPSTSSAATGVALFGCFSGTITLSDSRFASVLTIGFYPSSLPPCFRLPTGRGLAGSPDSRAMSFHTCTGSLTPPQPSIPRPNGMTDVTFPFVGQGQPTDCGDFGAQWLACVFPCQRFPIALLTVEA